MVSDISWPHGLDAVHEQLLSLQAVIFFDLEPHLQPALELGHDLLSGLEVAFVVEDKPSAQGQVVIHVADVQVEPVCA